MAPTMWELHHKHHTLGDSPGPVPSSRIRAQPKLCSPILQQVAHRRHTLRIKHLQNSIPTQHHPTMVALCIVHSIIGSNGTGAQLLHHFLNICNVLLNLLYMPQCNLGIRPSRLLRNLQVIQKTCNLHLKLHGGAAPTCATSTSRKIAC